MQRQVEKRSYLNRGVRYGVNIPTRLRYRLMRNIVGSITGVHTNQNVIAFTFDDGPHPEYTPRLIDILNKYNAKATFFMVGEFAEHYPEVVKYAAFSGHVIANHTWNHPAVPVITRRERVRQILACEQTLYPYINKLFRPPYGFQTIPSYVDARILGYQIVTWTKSVEDWLDHDADRLAKNITQVLKPGHIILMHDVLYHTIADRYADRNPLINAIETVLRRNSDRFSFVTIPELLRHGRVVKSLWLRKPIVTWLNALNQGTARQY